MRTHFINLPDRDLAYFPEGTAHFDDYVKAVGWAQGYARANREIMMRADVDRAGKATAAVSRPQRGDQLSPQLRRSASITSARSVGDPQRRGARRARASSASFPAAWGRASYIVRGKGNPESFHSCSHGAGRKMSRTQAKKSFTVHDHALATEGVECRKDAGVIDETPAAYKDIDAVMAAQADLVEVVHTLKQVVCVKG